MRNPLPLKKSYRDYYPLTYENIFAESSPWCKIEDFLNPNTFSFMKARHLDKPIISLKNGKLKRNMTSEFVHFSFPLPHINCGLILNYVNIHQLLQHSISPT